MEDGTSKLWRMSELLRWGVVYAVGYSDYGGCAVSALDPAPVPALVGASISSPTNSASYVLGEVVLDSAVVDSQKSEEVAFEKQRDIECLKEMERYCCDAVGCASCSCVDCSHRSRRLYELRNARRRLA
jgi:hypothetical protein